jgi:hypothetical protein
MSQMSVEFSHPETRSNVSLETKLRAILWLWEGTLDPKYDQASTSSSEKLEQLIQTLSLLSETPLYGPQQVTVELPSGAVLSFHILPASKLDQEVANMIAGPPRKSFRLTIQLPSYAAGPGGTSQWRIYGEPKGNSTLTDGPASYPPTNSPPALPYRRCYTTCPRCLRELALDLFG